MIIIKAGTELLSDLGWGIIKNSGRILYGGGQAVVGMVTEDEELVENGVRNLAKGAGGLSLGLVKKAINGDESEDGNEDIDLES